MSRTSDCDPNEIASPNTPAPAISGAVSTPRCDSTISAATTAITTPNAARSIGSTVCRREPGDGLVLAAGQPGTAIGILEMPVDRHARHFPGDGGDEQRTDGDADRLHRPRALLRRQFEGFDPDPGEREQRGEHDRGAQDALRRARRQRGPRPAAPASGGMSRRDVAPAARGQPLEDEQHQNDRQGRYQRPCNTTAARATGRTRRTAAAGQSPQNAIGSQQAGKRGAQRAEQTAAARRGSGPRPPRGRARRSAHKARKPARRRSAR